MKTEREFGPVENFIDRLGQSIVFSFDMHSHIVAPAAFLRT